MSETEELLSGVAVNMLMSQDGGVVTNHTKHHMCVDLFFSYIFSSSSVKLICLRFIKFETMMIQFIPVLKNKTLHSFLSLFFFPRYACRE